MKTLALILIAATTFGSQILFSQGCLPEGISFYTQEQIDNFQANYPGCTEIEGYILISGYTHITNLEGLNIISSISGFLAIVGNLNLDNLEGLNALTYIGGDLIVGDAYVGNTDLTSLEGLNNLTSIGGNVQIGMNFSLSSLNGLENLTSIGGILEIYYNENLISIMNLCNLTNVGGSIQIALNEYLTSLTGLDNINPGSMTDLSIYQNFSLSTCDVQSICEYLAAPIGTIEIHDNAIGCNSPEEVVIHCLTSTPESTGDGTVILSPNPATTFITLTAPGDLPIEQAIVYNHLGQKVLTAKPVNNTVDVSGLKAGMYLIEVSTRDRRERIKFVKN